LENDEIVISKSPEKEAIYIEEEEEEDDEKSFFKKHTEDYPTICSARLVKHLFQRIKIYASFHRHFSCFSLFRSPYLVFRAFRI